MARFEPNIYKDFATLLVDDIVSRSVSDNFVAVKRQQLIHESNGVVDIDRPALLGLGIHNFDAYVVSRVECRLNDSTQRRLAIEFANAVLGEFPPRRKALAVGMVGPEFIEEVAKRRA
jgi:hypothetical protein